MNKKSIFLSFLIGQIFIWTGSAFMTVLYHLYDHFGGAAVTLLTEGLFYVMQALGIAAYALCYKYKKSIAEKPVLISAALLFTTVVTALSCTAQGGMATAVLGCVMNIGIGILSGQLFTRIAVSVPHNECGLVFGIAYAMGSIGTYLLSLPEGGSGLTSDHILYIYLGMMALSIVLSRFLPQASDGKSPISTAADPLPDGKRSAQTIADTAPDGASPAQISADRKLILLAVATVFLCYFVYTLGYHFATMDMSAGVDPAFTRAFYACSLIAAAVVTDRNRKAGFILGFLILVFPFISLALRGVSGTATLLCILSYLFLGFLSVWHIILFIDLGAGSVKLTYLAPFGILLDKLGSAAGTASGLFLDRSQIALTLVAAAFFIICGVLFALLFFETHRRTVAAGASASLMPGRSDDHVLLEFQVKYSLNTNQRDVLKRILNGDSNAKIAADLCLAESTVKYHVKNVLKATGCNNRKELLELFQDFRA